MLEERTPDPGYVGYPFKISSYRVLISHRYVRAAEYLRLVRMLDKEAERDSTWRWKNFSVPRDAPIMSPSEAQQGDTYNARMRERMGRVHVVLFIARDEWLDNDGSLYLELIEAPLVPHRPKIPIINVLPRGDDAQSLRYDVLPVATVKWNSRAIVSAIREHAIPALPEELLLTPAESRDARALSKLCGRTTASRLEQPRLWGLVQANSRKSGWLTSSANSDSSHSVFV